MNLFLDFCHLKVGSLFILDNSDPKIIFRFFFSIFCHFLCNLKVGSLFVLDNSDPKMFLDYFLDFCHFLCNLKVGPKILFRFFFENVMSISIFELEKYEGSIVGSVEDVDC